MYRELEQFLGIGQERLIWLFTYKNAGGCLVGLLIGQRLGEWLWGTNSGVLLTTIACVALGLIITTQQRGMTVGQRLLMRLRFYVIRAVHRSTVDAATLYPTTAPPTTQPVLLVRALDGQPLLLQQQLSESDS